MRSKITIHTAPNFKPCIRVQEAGYPNNTEEQYEDVRDVLVKGFHELLHHKSNTAQIVFEVPNEYLILPVEDELNYIEGVIMNKWIKDSESIEQLLKIADLIYKKLTKENI